MSRSDSPFSVLPWLSAAFIAAVLTVAPARVGATAEPDPTAALGPADTRLGKLQRLLTELELYRGAIDGQPSPALSAALLQFRQATGLPLDDALSDALFDQLEASLRIQRLTRFLATLGREQSEQARTALLSQPATRDLIAPPTGGQPSSGAGSGSGSVPAPPVGAVFECLRAPSAACLIDAAVEASQSIDEARLRDWALSEIVKAQARAGAADAARATIRRLTDPRQIIVSLRDLATAQAERREIDAALATAASIPDPLARIEAELAIAARQIEAGTPDSARASLDRADPRIDQLDEPLQRVALRSRVASLRWRAGDSVGTDAALATAQAEIRRLPSQDGRATALGFVATALAEIGRPADALRLIADNRIGDDAPAALAAAAGASARGPRPDRSRAGRGADRRAALPRDRAGAARRHRRAPG